MVSRHSSNSACGRGKFSKQKWSEAKKPGPLDLEIFLEINPHYFQANICSTHPFRFKQLVGIEN